MDGVKGAFCVGRRVYLRAPTLEDACGDWYSWFNDPETSRYLNRWRPNSVESQVQFYEKRVRDGDDVVFAVIDKETDSHVGVTSISRIDWVNRFADIALVIGDRVARAEGAIGFEAFALTVRIAFMRMNLENLKGGYLAAQTHSEIILKAMRFREVGRMRGLFFVDGKREDQVLVQLDRETWLARNKLGGSPE